jgi:hypothetical protein
MRQAARGASMRKLARIRALYKDKRRHVYLFDDLHCIFTSGAMADARSW